MKPSIEPDIAAYALNDIDGWHDDTLLSQQLNQCFGQHNTTVGLLG